MATPEQNSLNEAWSAVNFHCHLTIQIINGASKAVADIVDPSQAKVWLDMAKETEQNIRDAQQISIYNLAGWLKHKNE